MTETVTKDLEWSLEKIISGLLASSEFRYRKPSKSPRFFINEDKFQSVWHMELKYVNSHIEIKLCLSGSARSNFFLNNFEICLKSENNLEWTSFKKKEVFSMDLKPEYCISAFISKSALQYLHDQSQSFTVICKMKLQLIGCHINSVPVPVPDFENLMYDAEFSDLMLVASGKQFKVHKNILATRSNTFYNMIKQNSRERRENVIVIEQFDDEVVQELIRYIYCGRVENLTKLSKNLLKAAEKYNIEGLKLICLEEFCRNMTVENACKLLFLLDLYQVDDLKSQVLNFIVYNLQHFHKTDFLAFKNPNLLREIFFKTVEVYVE